MLLAGVYRIILQSYCVSYCGYNAFHPTIASNIGLLMEKVTKAIYEPRCEKTGLRRGGGGGGGGGGVPTRSDTNQAVQPQKMARGMKFRI